MVKPIFGTDVSGIQWMQETLEGAKVTGTYCFASPETRGAWQAAYVPYPIRADGDMDISDTLSGNRMDTSSFSFELTASGLQYLKEGINKGSSTTSGSWWSHSLVGRIYSTVDSEVKYWAASGARIDTVSVTPTIASWRATVTILHKPPTITGATPAGDTYTEYPGAATDPVLNPHTVGSGSLFTYDTEPWYVADVGFTVSNNVIPIYIDGEQNLSKNSRTVRDIGVVVAPYAEDLETYVPKLNTYGTGVLTLATGRTVTFTSLKLLEFTQLPFAPTTPATVGLRGRARTISLSN